MRSASAKMRCPFYTWRNAAEVPEERVEYAALKYFRSQVAPVLAAQRTLDPDPRRRQRLHHGGDVLIASFAGGSRSRASFAALGTWTQIRRK
jgi:hypothetical protein